MGLNGLMILIFLLGLVDDARSKTDDNSRLFIYNTQDTLGFTKYLISQKEYYRAYIELMRINSYYPDLINGDILYITQLYLLFKGESYFDIINNKYDSMDKDVKYIEGLFTADVYLSRSEYLIANSFLLSFKNFDSNRDLNKYIFKRKFVTSLLLMKTQEAKKILFEMKEEVGIDEFFIYKDILKYSEEKFNSFKNASNSLFFGVVPGMGYISAGRKPTGILAFLLVSLVSTLTYYSFQTGNKSIGIFMGAIGTFFYTGSILGGYLASKRYNDGIMKNLEVWIFERMSLAKDREKIIRQYGIYRIKQ